ncbi:cytochrome P450 family protein [Nocardiopsis chromatogenes]|uniref:cytochrome P450 family protein n=1 Tax=Nocardiopsis chromatogenes TaxID=280239 RepID=UPI00034A2F08|nr:cytochrome P450 [Nocardiopsis chromatogenes]
MSAHDQNTGTADGKPPILDGPGFKPDSPARFAELRERGPIHPARFTNGTQGWVVVEHELARSALNHPGLLKDPAAAAIRPDTYRPGTGFAGNMLMADPPDHTRLRKLVSGAFTPRSTERLKPRIEQICRGLLDRIAPKGRADLVLDYTRPLPMTVISELLGVPEERRDEFQEWSNQAMGVTGGDRIEGGIMLNRYLAELLEDKRRAPDDALLSALISVHDEHDGRLSDEELLGTAVLLVIAGHETTVNLLGNALAVLLRRPDQADRLRAEPDLLPGAVEEFLRTEAPVELTPARFAAEDMELGGRRVAKGDAVLVALGSANLDADGAEADVARKDARHLSFGHGVHYCLGAPLARAEAVIGLRELLTRFPDMAAEEPDAEPPRIPEGIMRGPLSLPVRFTPESAA